VYTAITGQSNWPEKTVKTMGNEQQNKRNIKRDKYSTTCVIFNSLTVLLMTAVAIVIPIKDQRNLQSRMRY